MSNMKTVSLVDIVNKRTRAAVAADMIKVLTPLGVLLEHVVNNIEELRARVERLEQGGAPTPERSDAP